MTVVGRVAAHAEGSQRLAFDALDLTGGAQDIRRGMPRIDIGQRASRRIQEAEEHRDKHALAVVLAELPVDRFGDILRRRWSIQMLEELHRDSYKAPRARHEHCCRGTLPR